MVRALVLAAHPVPDSYGAALRDATAGALRGRGWDVDLCDLYAERFDPVLSEAERRGYHEVPANRGPVESYVARVEAADALVMVFPVWNFGYPAILKGFLDRVFLPGVSFLIRDGKLAPNLTRVRRLAAVTTYGGTRMRAMLCGDPPRRCVTRAVRFVCQPRTMRYLALYDMNRASDARRGAFLKRVEAEMGSF
ncbi:NAD(P)H-dependent oxidoreductase [Jannaschia aquimarina]|uniref:AzoR_3 protein n=1 Tax=Jannaschia aquimarina TaxID=935700 RepID=A0A0D1ED62_9RHOB|nr:NAD(P)H-dependent oxidoreductase [Jannaschia aquimarina]KIT14851.1 FMN-dependent NADH-azoreductase [Jannaschia aquimarina]SNS57549.1 Putative NADPH-quinone reductase (modulator of drug activity B) [Jannaschia aquimarina]